MPLSRQQMEDIIATGGSVIYNGQIHTRTETLPGEAELAGGDATKVQAALDGIAVQRAQLDAQEQTLLASLAPQDTGGKRGKKAQTDAGSQGGEPGTPDAPSLSPQS